MNIVGVLVVTVIALMLGWMAYVMFKAQKLKGQTLPKSTIEIGVLVKNNNKALLYFYSLGCGQCVTMTPIIDEMKRQGKAVEKLDVSQQLDVAQTLNVRATPTLLLIVNSQIEQVILGAKPKDFIENLLS